MAAFDEEGFYRTGDAAKLVDPDRPGVGLAFDGNKEGLASDMVFDGTTTRTIHVDARYMLWTMDRLDGADHLVKELGIEPKL